MSNYRLFLINHLERKTRYHNIAFIGCFIIATLLPNQGCSSKKTVGEFDPVEFINPLMGTDSPCNRVAMGNEFLVSTDPQYG